MAEKITIKVELTPQQVEFFIKYDKNLSGVASSNIFPANPTVFAIALEKGCREIARSYNNLTAPGTFKIEVGND